VLSQKPIFAILHQQSTAVSVIRDAKAGIVLDFNGPEDVPKIKDLFLQQWKQYIEFVKSYHPEQVDHSYFDAYSAKNITATLVSVLNQI